MMAFVASIDRQLELQLAGSCMKIGHHSARHCDARVPLMDCPLGTKRKNGGQTHVLCVLCFGCSYHEDRKKTPVITSLSIQMCWAGGNLGLEHWDVLRSYFSVDPPRIQLRYVHNSFYRHVSKISPFFSSPFACLKLSEVVLFLQWGYRLIGMVSIARTCPWHNCSHLGKAVVKPSTVLESPALLHNSAPKFGLSFTG